MDAIYLAFDVHPDKLMGVLPAMRSMGFAGVNLTVPLKEVAFRGISDLDETAARLGAVNTVQFLNDGSLRGHNTDGDGFVLALDEAFGADVRGMDVFVMGCGGAGRAVALTCAAGGAAALCLADLDRPRVERVAAEIPAVNPACRVEIHAQAEEMAAAARACDLVVQATPLGMKDGDPSPLPPAAFRKDQLTFDLIYMYPETAFMRAAGSAGAAAANGLGMLLHQGAKAFTIWTGKPACVEAMRRALESHVYGTGD
jgi:shikimate dehydrogenase